MTTITDDSPRPSSSPAPWVQVILNPAGGAVAATTLALLQETLAALKLPHQIYELQYDWLENGRFPACRNHCFPTEPTLEKAQFARSQVTADEALIAVVHTAIDNGAALIVAAGGDGTVSTVAHALATSSHAATVPLAILPLGTANLIARDLGIPLALADACALWTEPRQTVTVDAMRIDGRFYFSHVSLGLYAQLAAETASQTKRWLGRFGYLFAAVRRICQQRSWRFLVHVDGNVLSLRASTILIANVRTVGIGGLQWGDEIAMDDGELDLCIVRARTIGDYGRALGQLWRREQTDHALIRYIRVRERVNVITAADLPVRADGEIIGRSQVDIEVAARALQVVVP